MPDSLSEKIAKDLQKSGFPLEMYVLNVCSAKNTGRLPSFRYEYMGHLREIDLITFFETIDIQQKNSAPTLQHTKTQLTIECKKSEGKPWVFFSSPSYQFENVASLLNYRSDFNAYFSNRQDIPLLAQIYPRIKKSHYSDHPSISRCVAYYEAFKDKASQPSEIYKAIDSVITYLCYEDEWRARRSEEYGVYSQFNLPVVVLDGLLFEASMDGANVLVRERSHIQLRTFHPKNMYIIDVVTRDYFQQFLDRVEKFHKELCTAIRALKFSAEFRAGVRAKQKNKRFDSELYGDLKMAIIDAKRGARPRRKIPLEPSTRR